MGNGEPGWLTGRCLKLVPEFSYEVSAGSYNPILLMPMHPLNHFFLASCLLPLPIGILPLSSLSSVPSALAHPPLAQISEGGKTRADHLLQRGRQQSNAGGYSAAIQILEQALAAYRAIPDRHGEAQTLKPGMGWLVCCDRSLPPVSPVCWYPSGQFPMRRQPG